MTRWAIPPILVLLIIAVPPALAQDNAPANSRYDAWKDGAKDAGIDFSLNYTSEDLTAVSGGTSNALVHAGQVSLTAQIDMDKIVGWKGASLFASVSHRDGRNINTVAGLNTLLGPQEIFGRGNVTRLSQFWIDQKITGTPLSLRVGRLNPGSDFESFDCNFINLSYCGNQVGNIVSDYWYNYPISQWGAVAQIDLGGATYAKLGAYQVNPRNLKYGFATTLNPDHGTGMLLPVELGWIPMAAGGPHGAFQIGGWYSTAKRGDVYLDPDHLPAAASQSFLQHDGSYGGYVSLVADIGHHANDKAQGLSLFINATVADKKTSVVNRTVATGAVYSGPFAGRPKDQVGIAVAFNHLDGRVADYRREALALGVDVAAAGTDERALELFYGLQISHFLQLRPDLQWIHRPGGADRPDALILGMRTSITL